MIPGLFANDDLPTCPARRQPTKVAFDQFDHMRVYDAWWQDARQRLEWRPIATYEDEARDLVVGEPTIVRSNHQWALAILTTDGWAKFTEGASYPLDHFRPIEWALPMANDVAFLARE